jgi:hypothetical protein
MLTVAAPSTTRSAPNANSMTSSIGAWNSTGIMKTMLTSIGTGSSPCRSFSLPELLLPESELRSPDSGLQPPGFLKDGKGVLWYKGWICVPNIKEMKDKTLHEAYESAYSIHPGGNKMYHDLKATNWWYGMKKDVAEYVALCDTCQ